jgi:tubulin polyglutamylase TTLL6/13
MRVHVNLSYTGYSAVRMCAEELGYVVTDSMRKPILFWCDQAASCEFMSRLCPWQLYNHFPGMWAIGRKVDMIRNLERMHRALPDLYNFFPKSFILPGNYQDFSCYMARQETPPTYLVKPDRGSLGRGIILIQDAESAAACTDPAIAQEYISPFLVDGLKFDLRVYALVTSVDPLRVYIHREGMARFCTEPYEDPRPGNLEKVFSHLTNYSLNKKNEHFDFKANGHKRPMSTIFEEVVKRGFDLETLQHQIEEIIRFTISSILPFLANNYRSTVSVNDGKSRCFELLGFDILLDKDAKPWLLEVNVMPMLDIDTEFDRILKFSVIKGIFTILTLSAKFKSTVMKRQRAESEKRINGMTSLPMRQIFDPSMESRVTAESTDWKQLYPLLDDDSSEIESALSAVKTMTFASIENGAFRARQKAVLSQLQEIRDRESRGQWRPTTSKVYVAPLPQKKLRISSGSASAPALPKSQPVPVALPSIQTVDAPISVLGDFPRARPSRAISDVLPRKVTARAIVHSKVTEIATVCAPPSSVFSPQTARELRRDLPAPRIGVQVPSVKLVDTSKVPKLVGMFSEARPSFIDPEEEEERLQVLAGRTAQIRELGVERRITWHFRATQHIDLIVPRLPQSLLKIKHSLVARPVVKLAIAIHQIS